MFNITIIIYCLLFAIVAYKKPVWPLYIITAFLPSYFIRFSILGIPFTLLEAMILIVFLLFLFKHKFSWFKDFRKSPFFWPITSVLTFATVSVFTSPNTLGALGVWKAYFIEPLLFYIVFINTVKTKKQLHNIFWALGLSAVYLSLVAVWQFFSGWNMPDAFLNLRYDPVKILTATPEEVKKDVVRMLKDAGDLEKVGFCCINMGWDVPDENIVSIYSTVEEYRSSIKTWRA